MIEKVTLRMTPEGNFLPTGPIACQDLNPKALLLYAAAKCAGLTAAHIMKKARMTPERFEVTVSGELSTDTVQSESMYLSFRFIYNVVCDPKDQIKASRAMELTHDHHCSMVRMLGMIAPVSHEIAVAGA